MKWKKGRISILCSWHVDRAKWKANNKCQNIEKNIFAKIKKIFLQNSKNLCGEKLLAKSYIFSMCQNLLFEKMFFSKKC